MSEGFTAKMARTPDEELVRISLASEHDFDPTAIQAAKEELARRGTSEAVITAATEDAASEASFEASRPTLPLSNALWVVFIVIGPILFVSVGAALILWARGYTQKAKDAFHGILLGFVFWGLISGGFAMLGA